MAGVREGAMHLLLDLDPSTEPVSGRVGLVGTQPQSFTGYANLIATLESIRTATALDMSAGSQEGA